MPRTRIDFRSLTLFEDEEFGDTHMAVYVTVTDSNGAVVGQFQWNNSGEKVNEVNTYQLDNDPGNTSTIDFELDTFGTISVEAYADDDQDWPNAGSHENSLGSASIVFDPHVPATLGSVIIGPTRTDNGNTGYLINADIAVVPDQMASDVRIKFENLILFEDEEWGDTHMAIYVRAEGPGIDQEIFRWNNGGAKVDEVNVYGLDNSPDPIEVTLLMTGLTAIIVDGYADDDQDWPSSSSHENSLGIAMIVVDPADPGSAGQRQLGPTTTDNGNRGFVVNASIEILPATPQPDLSIVGMEVTQAIQHFHSTLGQDNSVPLVANKKTIVRVYLDSGIDPSINGGQVSNVSGVLTVTGDSNFVINPISSMTAQPISSVDPTDINATLNFILPEDQATGNLTLTAQASVGSNVSNPESVSVKFNPVNKLKIIMVRIATPLTSAPGIDQYTFAFGQLQIIYPIPTDPSLAIHFYHVPGSEEILTNHDLTTDDGVNDLLDDLEDIQEDSHDDSKKLYGLLNDITPFKHGGIARPGDNIAYGYSHVMIVGHEMGHVYDLKHAPCGPGGDADPADVDDNFIPHGGLVGEVGVDTSHPTALTPTFGDLMSYCESGYGEYHGQWISAYDWTKLFNTFKG